MKKIITSTIFIPLFFVLLLVHYNGTAQISYAVSGSNYTQNFDAILAVVPANNTVQAVPALPAGWVWTEAGINANATYRVDNGTSSTNDFFLLGATGNTERAIGGYSGNNLTSQWGASFTNNTGSTLTQFTLTYTGEQWRDGGSFTSINNVDAFSYSINSATSLTTGVWTNVTQLNFTAPVNNFFADVALNGNLATNKTLITFTVTGITWAAGQTLWIRWTDPNESGNDDAMGIDDVTFTAAAPSITTSAISPLTYCSGTTVLVPYTKTGTFNVGNTFTAQLSDATGSFAAPVNIGTLVSTNAGTITATIPPGTPTGTLYRIRVVSNNPVVTGSNNGANISITTVSSATISYSGSPYCTNISGPQNVTLTGTTGGTFSAAGGLTLNAATGLITPSTSTAGPYVITYTMAAVGACPSQTATTSIVINQPAATCIMGTGVVNVPSLPYISNGRTTCGKVNDLTSANTISCGIPNYLNGEDEVFIFTPAISGNITITLTSNGSRTGLMLYDGCPLNSTCTTTSCIGYEQSTSGNKSLCTNVTAGKTYYLIVDSWANPPCNNYNIQIDAPVVSLPGSLCSNAIPISSLPVTMMNETTKCHGDDYNNGTIGSCGTLYESGEDKVYTYTAATSECIGITITGANSNSIGFQVYSGCPGTLGTTCIGNGGGAVNGTLSGTITLPSAGTYYIVIDNQAAPNYVNYNLSIASFGAGIPNDIPCNATPLTLGISYIGSNTCSSGAGEPSNLPACWGPAGNTRNTVWFSVTAPASGKLRIRAIPNSLTNPQIALYGGVCGTSMTLLGCSDDASGCGSTSNYSSDLQVSGLTPGATYYVVVDGYGIMTGSFGILAIDGAQPLPPLSNGQDCGNYIQVCDTIMSFGNPGFQSFGNICDFSGNGANCLNAGERGSAWFEVDINANGFLSFSIVPKDWTGPAMPVGNETDYDFAVWKIAGTGAVTCADIASPNDAVPVACNYSALGVTGLYSAANGVAPPQYPGYGGAFGAQLAVTNGDKYAIVVSNYATSTSGFDIIFGNPAPISYGGGGLNSVNWSGGVDTDWFKKENWGGCAIPSCGLDAIINGGIVLQPSINAPANAKSVLINPGASLTLNPTKSLTICENFTNLGTFNAATNSTVIFNNPSFTQNIDGNITGTNAFGNVTVTKAGGAVKLLQDADMKGNFLISNATSAFNGNSKIHSVSGNFTNNGFYLPGANGTLILNGSGHQDYDSPSNLNNLIINNTSASGIDVYDVTPVNAQLTLTSGVLHVTSGEEIQVLNRAPGAVTSGNNLSYIDGVLRRYINSQGSYDFPLGKPAKGYQLANINFNDPSDTTIIDNISGEFHTFASLPPPVNSNDCGINYTSAVLDNGYWFFDAFNPNSGKFDMILHNQNYTNVAYKWTIMSFDGFNWNIANGNCAPSVATAVTRTGMKGFGLYFGTAQGPSLLPIELLSFNAYALTSSILTSWTTFSEKNNSGFEVERADPTGEFHKIGWVNGAGTTTAVHAYHFDDKNVLPDIIYYYRLHQIDYDGKSSYSNTVAAQLHGRVINATVYPNPAAEEAIISYYLEQDAMVSIRLVNNLGQIIKLQDGVMQGEGPQQFVINSKNTMLAPGVYTIQITVNDRTEFLKLIMTTN